MKPTPQEEWKKDLVETIVASNLLTEAQGRAFLPFIEKCMGKTILADREKTVAVLREAVEATRDNGDQCEGEPQRCVGALFCNWHRAMLASHHKALQAFDTASKLLTPAREEKG